MSTRLWYMRPAPHLLAERNWYGAYPDVKARTWLEGRDGVLFSVDEVYRRQRDAWFALSLAAVSPLAV